MALMNVVWMVLFWAMQAIAALAFKYGSMAATHTGWVVWFLVGNAFGASSIWFVMLLYRTMNANVAMGLCFGGAFLIAQLALALVFRSPLSPLQYGGLLAITVGMYLLSAGNVTMR